MAEDAFPSELVIPGTQVRVQAEGLIRAGGVSTGNIGIVGTAATGTDAGVVLLSDYRAALDTFGPYDPFSESEHNLTRGLEILFRAGARTVFARAVANAGGIDAALQEVAREDVQILVAPEVPTAVGGTDANPTAPSILGTLTGIVDAQETQGRDMIAVVGWDDDSLGQITDEDVRPANKRLIMVAPGIRTRETVTPEGGPPEARDVVLPGRYAAAAVAGLLSTLAVQSSPTNKTVGGVTGVERRFDRSQLSQLLQAGILPLEQRGGVRVVRGITTDPGAFRQVTTRRIVDFAKAGIRQAANPFIGRLNNQRIRKALQGAVDSFLTGMLVAEALTEYSLEVTATRDDEIAGRVNVNALLQPTFSIDFILVTLTLQ